VDALPPLTGSAFWWMLCHLSFGRMLCRCGSSSPSADALLLGILVLRRRLCNLCVVGFLFAGLVVEVVWASLVLWVELVVFPMLLAAVRVFAVFSRLCARFFSVSLFLVLCVLVLVELYLAASRLCL